MRIENIMINPFMEKHYLFGKKIIASYVEGKQYFLGKVK